MRSGPRTICACAVTATKTNASEESFMPASPCCAPPRRDDATDEDASDVAVFEAFVGDRLGRERRRGEDERQRVERLHHAAVNVQHRTRSEEEGEEEDLGAVPSEPSGVARGRAAVAGDVAALVERHDVDP